MSRGRGKPKQRPPGHGKHRKARVQRFMAKHPDFITKRKPEPEPEPTP